MTTQTQVTDEVRVPGAGRKPKTKTTSTRRAVLKVLRQAETAMSTKEVAKVAKQSKLSVGQALRWAEKRGLATRTEETARHKGRGRPMSMWTIAQ